ncbi:MAG: MgtC/SapB family protein [Woeseia sp.]|nr:MgtC/SapB family protein [Woeseia sp.]NNE61131.1 MgtC/SapB family protein [Woeseia sp.]
MTGKLEFEWIIVLQLVGAIVLALPTAWNRERHSRIMGLRTFPLVSLGACAYVLVGQSFIGPDRPDAMARIMQGLLSGIGFVGGGAILKNSDHVKGTASAASIWITGALGAAVAFRLWWLAALLSLLNFSIVLVMSRVKQDVSTAEADE